MPEGSVVASFIVPGQPHPLLIPDKNPAYARARDAFGQVRKAIEELQPDLILLYSTQWLSVIGHQVQADPAPKWTHVDQEWHELGSIPYEFRVDPEYAAAYVEAGRARGLEMRTVAYEGFPVDTGSIVAMKLLNPNNRFPASMVSCNMYADRSETIVLGKAALDAAKATGKRIVAVAVTALSNRLHTNPIPFEEDRIHSLKDDEWNRKYLEILGDGRLEDASQLARQFSAQANGDQRMKAIWWLAAVSGQSNRFDGKVFAYEPLYGTGGALVGLWPTAKDAEEAEYDEDDAEVHLGDRNVLGGVSAFEGGGPADISDTPADTPVPETPPTRLAPAPPQPTAKAGLIQASKAPKPVGAYPHARRVGDFLFLSGLGSRVPGTDEVPGGPVRDADGKPLDYDAAAQTEQVIANLKTVLEEAGASLDDVLDVTCFLIDMDRDFKAFNEVYRKHFEGIQATRTTVAIRALPTPIAVEFKVMARAQ